MLTDEVLISRITEGDLASFQILMKRYERLVLITVKRIILDDQFSKDVSQEVFIKVFNNLKHFRFESKLSTWITRIAYSTSFNHLKKYSKKTFFIEEDMMEEPAETMTGPEEIFEKKELARLVHTAILQLPVEYRIVITLFHLNEQSYQEIVSITNLPEGTIKSYLYRGRQLLKKRLGNLASKYI